MNSTISDCWGKQIILYPYTIFQQHAGCVALFHMLWSVVITFPRPIGHHQSTDIYLLTYLLTYLHNSSVLWLLCEIVNLLVWWQLLGAVLCQGTMSSPLTSTSVHVPSVIISLLMKSALSVRFVLHCHSNNNNNNQDDIDGVRVHLVHMMNVDSNVYSVSTS